MSGTGGAVSPETLERYMAGDNRRRGRLVAGALFFWVIGSLVIDFVHFLPRGERYYLYLDLIIFPPIALFGLLVWKYPGSPKRIRTAVFLFSLAFLTWTAALASYQETPYTLFIAAFFVSASLLLRPAESVIVYSSSLASYVVAVTVHAGSPLGHGATLLVEVVAMTITAAIVSIVLYRQRAGTLEAEERLREKTRSQEQEIEARTEDLNRRLREREMLLREIHHRVKNNLQILASILRLSEAYRGGKDPQTLLLGAEHRILSMAMVHEQLYDTDNLESVDLGSYLEALSAYVLDSYAAVGELSFVTALESVRVPIDMAVNVGLLATEVLSNALKHAFDGTKKERRVSVSTRAHDSKLLLLVEDNGKGICSEVIDDTTRGGLGLVLVEALSKQLNGVFTYECSGGTTFRLELPFSLE